MISRRAALPLIVVHPKQNTENELKWQTCFGMVPSKLAVPQGKG